MHSAIHTSTNTATASTTVSQSPLNLDLKTVGCLYDASCTIRTLHSRFLAVTSHVDVSVTRSNV
ncbi:hypothetical protein EJ04DRAFT_508179 [Polyplosphaeria fusca]|uniref:Uncharacterized protein n=1 Tax=Polyplosphaeria fusca TaxID=682080 RepID=A0A9P4R6Y1_9PLEO|nr:hypothetical protein EJ04DRAFT_508179 [Polyplosphaeria fusca]